MLSECDGQSYQLEAGFIFLLNFIEYSALIILYNDGGNRKLLSKQSTKDERDKQ